LPVAVELAGLTASGCSVAIDLAASVCTDSCITCSAHGSVIGSITMTAGSKIGGK
jgi:hypothetical protein